MSRLIETVRPEPLPPSPPRSVSSDEYEEQAEHGRTFIRQSRIKAKLFTNRVLNRMNSRFIKALDVKRTFDGIAFDDNGKVLKQQKPDLKAIYKDVPIEIEDGQSAMPDSVIIKGIDPCMSERRQSESSFESMPAPTGFAFAI